MSETRSFVDLTEQGPEVREVVPMPSGRVSLAVARCVAGTALLARADIVVSDGRRTVPAWQAEGLLILEGRRLEVECRGPDAVPAMRLVSRQLRGLRGLLPSGARSR